MIDEYMIEVQTYNESGEANGRIWFDTYDVQYIFEQGDLWYVKLKEEAFFLTDNEGKETITEKRAPKVTSTRTLDNGLKEATLSNGWRVVV